MDVLWLLRFLQREFWNSSLVERAAIAIYSKFDYVFASELKETWKTLRCMAKADEQSAWESHNKLAN